MRVSYETMYREFVRVLLKRGFTKKKAELSARDRYGNWKNRKRKLFPVWESLRWKTIRYMMP